MIQNLRTCVILILTIGVFMDNHTPEQRHFNMSAIKSKNSKIEMVLRKALWDKGIRYRKNYKKLLGKPDIAIIKYKIAIFCDSEFWHGYNWDEKKNEIKSNQEFWYRKIENNIKRDRYVTETLQQQGWIVLRFWGKEILKDINKCVEIVKSFC